VPALEGRPRALFRRLWIAVVVCCSLSGCAGFWDDVTSRDFKFKDMFKPAPDPLWVIRNSSDGDKKSKALLALKEPLQHGGNQQEQDVIVKLLVESAVSDPQPLCRLAAISSLQRFKDPRAAQALIDAYDHAYYFQRERPDAMETIQEQALQALGINGNPIAVDLLVRVLKTPPLTGNEKDKQNDLNQRIYAARALAHYPQYQAAEALVSVLRTEQDVALRDRATESLREITGQDLPPDAQVWADFLHKSGKDKDKKEPFSHKPSILPALWLKKSPD
jgi:HEAT repeat protein